MSTQRYIYIIRSGFRVKVAGRLDARHLTTLPDRASAAAKACPRADRRGGM